MGFKQCEFCRRPHKDMGKGVCVECLLQLDEDFIEIREYLYEHENADIEEVSEATGVSRKSIFYLLKEERLLVGEESEQASGILKCEACKKPIRTGRMCVFCKKEVITALNDSIKIVKLPKPVEEDSAEKSIKGLAKLDTRK